MTKVSYERIFFEESRMEYDIVEETKEELTRVVWFEIGKMIRDLPVGRFLVDGFKIETRPRETRMGCW